KAYKEYYACATGEAAPKPKASARKKKGDSTSSTTPPTPTPTTTVVAAPRLSATAKDSHVTLTPVHPNGLQESLPVSSFVTSMLNPISDVGVESIFTTASSPIVSLQTPTPIMTPSTIATITTSSDAPIPPTTIPSIILENIPTFNSAFRFEMELKKILIEKIEGNKSAQRSDEQRNLYKALVEAYDADKAILDTTY
nr:hypothetical protein [Tanacetum cinerariifolium]